MFIHSVGEGKVSTLRKKEIDFSALLDDIEGYTYHYNTPKWLKTRKRSFNDLPNPSPKNSIDVGTSAGGGSNSNNDQKKRHDSKRGDKVTNSKLHDDLKVPSNLKYGDIFHPEMRKGIEPANHEDGTEKCNNWHHRGFCYSKCRWKMSHNKVLTEAEVE